MTIESIQNRRERELLEGILTPEAAGMRGSPLTEESLMPGLPTEPPRPFTWEEQQRLHGDAYMEFSIMRSECQYGTHDGM